jgi:hypothetical protein
LLEIIQVVLDILLSTLQMLSHLIVSRTP